MEGTIGEICIWSPAGYATRTNPPKGWMACEGQSLTISQNQILFSVFGTAYGGDGVKTFKLPDMRDPKQPPYHLGFGPSNPCCYLICVTGLYPSRNY